MRLVRLRNGMSYASIMTKYSRKKTVTLVLTAYVWPTQSRAAVDLSGVVAALIGGLL